MSKPIDITIKVKEVNIMGMDLLEFSYKSCIARCGYNDEEKWGTIYTMNSSEPGKGHGTILIIAMKRFFEDKGYRFASSVALSPAMKHLLTKYNIKEYE